MQSQDPFQFIHETKPNTGGGLGATKQGRMVVAVLGGLILLVIFVAVTMLFSANANKGKADLVDAAQQQTELIRISKLGVERARGSSAKNLARTTSLSLQSDQVKLTSAMNKQGIKISAKELALGKNTKTDALLTSAEQSNRFDTVFIQTIQSQLTSYQKKLQAAYNATSNKTLKETLKKQYTNAGILATAKQ